MCAPLGILLAQSHLSSLVWAHLPPTSIFNLGYHFLSVSVHNAFDPKLILREVRVIEGLKLLTFNPRNTTN